MQHIKHIWPTVKDVADALSVPYTTAHSWSARGRIPADYDLDLIRAAKKRGIKLTLEELAKARISSAQSDAAHNASPGHTSPARQRPTAKPAAKGRCA